MINSIKKLKTNSLFKSFLSNDIFVLKIRPSKRLINEKTKLIIIPYKINLTTNCCSVNGLGASSLIAGLFKKAIPKNRQAIELFNSNKM